MEHLLSQVKYQKHVAAGSEREQANPQAAPKGYPPGAALDIGHDTFPAL